MKILMTGSSGLVGSAIKEYLEMRGDEVVPMIRSKNSGVYWNPKKGGIDQESMEGFDALINLAGENIASGRWTKEKKQRIYDSRVLGTRLLAESVINLANPPKVVINASAIGYYGTSNTKSFTEEDPPGQGFLSEICVDWEKALEPITAHGTRTVRVRIGVVLSPKGAALGKMLLPFKLGLGGVVGSGKQPMSWIDIEDLVRIFDFCLHDERASGAINAIAPNPVTNKKFTKTLGKVLRRPTIFSMPAFAARLIFGEMADAILLEGTRAIPKKLTEWGFPFRYPHLEESLCHLIRSK